MRSFILEKKLYFIKFRFIHNSVRGPSASNNNGWGTNIGKPSTSQNIINFETLQLCKVTGTNNTQLPYIVDVTQPGPGPGRGQTGGWVAGPPSERRDDCGHVIRRSRDILNLGDDVTTTGQVVCSSRPGILQHTDQQGEDWLNFNILWVNIQLHSHTPFSFNNNIIYFSYYTQPTVYTRHKINIIGTGKYLILYRYWEITYIFVIKV